MLIMIFKLIFLCHVIHIGKTKFNVIHEVIERILHRQRVELVCSSRI